MKNAYRISVGKTKGMRPLVTPMTRRCNNAELDLKDVLTR